MILRPNRRGFYGKCSCAKMADFNDGVVVEIVCSRDINRIGIRGIVRLYKSTDNLISVWFSSTHAFFKPQQLRLL